MIRELEIPKNEEIDPLANPGKVSGFVSPAQDYEQRRLHIAERIVTDPTNTHYFEADNNEMRHYGIMKGSIIIVDKSVKPTSNTLIVCWVETEFLTRRLYINGNSQFLCINDTLDCSINITGREIVIFGVVTWTCLPHHNRKNVRTSRL